MCLRALYRLLLQLLPMGRGTPVVALAASRILFVIVIDTCCEFLVRQLAPCLWATGISCHLFFGFKVR